MKKIAIFLLLFVAVVATSAWAYPKHDLGAPEGATPAQSPEVTSSPETPAQTPVVLTENSGSGTGQPEQIIVIRQGRVIKNRDMVEAADGAIRKRNLPSASNLQAKYQGLQNGQGQIKKKIALEGSETRKVVKTEAGEIKTTVKNESSTTNKNLEEAFAGVVIILAAMVAAYFITRRR